mmetsp:Transcript_358/g.1411  ORF Transcript_358/g.1411 Transcript_358/m.1411 type:complete len:253 (+) Transcript_358:3139-3897(+)
MDRAEFLSGQGHGGRAANLAVTRNQIAKRGIEGFGAEHRERGGGQVAIASQPQVRGGGGDFVCVAQNSTGTSTRIPRPIHVHVVNETSLRAHDAVPDDRRELFGYPSHASCVDHRFARLVVQGLAIRENHRLVVRVLVLSEVLVFVLADRSIPSRFLRVRLHFQSLFLLWRVPLRIALALHLRFLRAHQQLGNRHGDRPVCPQRRAGDLDPAVHRPQHRFRPRQTHHGLPLHGNTHVAPNRDDVALVAGELF